MAQAMATRPSGVPWSVRLFEVAPVSPVWTGLAVLLAFLAVFALFAAGTGLPFWARLVDFELLHGAFIAYAPMAAAISLRGSRRDLEELGPLLRGGTPDTFLREVLDFDRRHLLLAGAAGLLVAVGILLDPATWGDDGRPAAGDPLFAWIVGKVLLQLWLISRTMYLDVAISLRFSRIGEHHTAVDLLDRGPLAVFARHGLRSVLLWVGLLLLLGLLYLQPYGRDLVTRNSIFVVATASAALMLPVLGVHRRLRAEKARELARVRAAIEADRELTLAAAPGAPVHSRLSHLVAYHGLVESTGTWPFDLSTWLRFGLYVGLGLGSWLGAALVERLLDFALR